VRIREIPTLLAERYGPQNTVSVRTVQGWCSRSVNPLPCINLGNRLLVSRDVLWRWIEAGNAAPPKTTQRAAEREECETRGNE
jgi:hypothetical protein